MQNEKAGGLVLLLPRRDQRPEALLPGAGHWARLHSRRLLITDTATVLAIVTVAAAVRFERDRWSEASGSSSHNHLSASLDITTTGLTALAGGHQRDRRAEGNRGPDETARVNGMTWRLFAAIAVATYTRCVWRSDATISRSPRLWARPAAGFVLCAAAVAALAAGRRAKATGAWVGLCESRETYALFFGTERPGAVPRTRSVTPLVADPR